MNVDPLSDDERRWLRRLENVLRDMPDRLLILECGSVLLLVDRAAATQMDDISDGKASRAGIVLASVRHSACKVTGVSG